MHEAPSARHSTPRHAPPAPALAEPVAFAPAPVAAEPARPVSAGESLHFWGAVGASGAAVVGVLWLLSLLINPAFVAGGALASTAWLARGTVRRMEDVGAALGWEVRDEAQMDEARGAVEANMKAAAVCVARLWGTIAFALLGGAPLLAGAAVLFCAFFGPRAGAVEEKFRSMKVRDDLAPRFSRLIAAWREPRWNLPPDA